MSGFLDEYITNRGESTIIRTQYGILDSSDGEHLVPVEHPENFFSDLQIRRMNNKPNQNYVELHPLASDIPAPVWHLTKIDGNSVNQPYNGSILNVDGTSVTSFEGTLSWSDEKIHTMVNVEFFENGVKVNDPVIDGDTWTWTNSIAPGEYIFKIKGYSKDNDSDPDDLPSLPGELQIVARLWNAFVFKTNLSTIPDEQYASLKLNVSVDENSGPAPYTYVWKRNNFIIPNQTTNQLNITPADQNQNGNYNVTVTDSLGRSITSNTHSTTVYSALTTSGSVPASLTVYTGAVLSLRIDRSSGGKAPFIFRWKKRVGNVITVVQATTDATFVKMNCTPADSGYYFMELVTVIDGVEYFISSSECNVTVVDLAPPVFTNFMIDGFPWVNTSQVEFDGTPLTHTVTCDFSFPSNGSSPNSFALYDDTNKIVDITSDMISNGRITITLDRTQLPFGVHHLRIDGRATASYGNAFSSISSSPIYHIKLDDPFRFDASLPETTTVALNANVTLSVNAIGGSPPYDNAWYKVKNGVTTKVSSKSNYAITKATAADAAQYYATASCVINGVSHTITSNTTTLVVQ